MNVVALCKSCYLDPRTFYHNYYYNGYAVQVSLIRKFFGAFLETVAVMKGFRCILNFHSFV